jgi:preprotein translocase subunit SecE
MDDPTVRELINDIVMIIILVAAAYAIIKPEP